MKTEMLVCIHCRSVTNWRVSASWTTRTSSTRRTTATISASTVSPKARPCRTSSTFVCRSLSEDPRFPPASGIRQGAHKHRKLRESFCSYFVATLCEFSLTDENVSDYRSSQCRCPQSVRCRVLCNGQASFLLSVHLSVPSIDSSNGGR